MRRYDALLLAVALINLGGTAFGFYYYRGMFELFPVKLWIFIPDSPLATLFFAISLFLIYLKKRVHALYLIAMAQSVKYGFWTMFVILYFSDYFLAPDHRSYYYLMFALHFGMVIQPALILHRVRIARKELAIAAAWLALNDYFDYLVGTNPLVVYDFAPEKVALTGAVTFLAGMTILALL
ncbi:MAG: DUF1405 domain-containing protein, partial [Euryarchaeota archaeon]|nr:DUF1405 domain-containing protein [Euryarchaeota archaeon]